MAVFLLSSDAFARPIYIDLASMYTLPPPASWTGAVFKGAAARLTAAGHHDLVVAGGQQVLALVGPRDPATEANIPADPLAIAAIDHMRLVPDRPAGAWVALAIGDFDGDARPDLALAADDRPTVIALYSQKEASPNCLCGPDAQCAHPDGPHILARCFCTGANRLLESGYARCEACASGFFPVADGACAACHGNCRECTGPEVGQCTACSTGWHLLNGVCGLAPAATVTVRPEPGPGTPAVYFQASEMLMLDTVQMLAVTSLSSATDQPLLFNDLRAFEHYRQADFSPAGAEPRRAEALLIRGAQKRVVQATPVPGSGHFTLQTPPALGRLDLVLRRMAESLHMPMVGTDLVECLDDRDNPLASGTGRLCDLALRTLAFTDPLEFARPTPARVRLRRTYHSTDPGLAPVGMLVAFVTWHPVDNRRGQDRWLVAAKSTPSSHSCSYYWTGVVPGSLDIMRPHFWPVDLPLGLSMPCAQPHSLPQDPAGVHPPPMLLSVAAAKVPGNPVLLYLWRSISTVDGHARMDAPVPLLRSADLGYPQGTSPTTFQLAIMPHTLRHDRAELFFWDGQWFYSAHARNRPGPLARVDGPGGDVVARAFG
ncbi:hypothetical protein H696_06319 [Fonticula alba]|uniref:Uncharacterized protein n=1 Tax=Fonticula alba TaxID=691883 RepID=A0A058YZ43_FONAL|nr:hypothetical protein H696_06319 [Fonticula alba]KCV67259.1 hypothetical protein H696_06319 [Fonticula alba]|eukprot:XP_009498336.1 hypothetical protein H696_06319 [Fonticula alba]